MKCSKCGYIGFDSADRCRNCGYEFSLAPTFAMPDLPIRQDTNTTEGLDDLALIDAGTARKATSGFDAEFGRGSGESRAPAAARTSPSARAAASDLPLFGGPIDDDTPLITKPSPPRTPLSVRRSTPDLGRLRTAGPRTASFDLGLDLDPPASAAPRVVPSERAQSVDWTDSGRRVDAGAFRRVLATLIDGFVLLAIDLAIVYLTVQICGISVAEFGQLPTGPLVAFLLVQNVGYLVIFTAGGQTLGKMAVGIEIITFNPDATMDLGRALKRTVAWLVLAGPAGLGLLTALISHDHRGFHDRVAGTRVVRV